MQEFRKFVKGPLGVGLLVLFTVPFVASGFYGYFTSSGDGDVVATVGDADITGRALDAQVGRLRDQVRQQSPQLDIAMIEQFVGPAMVLESMINNELLAQFASDGNMYVSDAQAGALLSSLPQFQDANGKLDQAAIERFARGQGMSPRGWIAGLRRDLVMRQVSAGFEMTGFGLDSELNEQRRLAEQLRTFRYLVKPVNAEIASQQATDEQVQAWYDAHADEFMLPEEYKLSWIELDPASYRAKATVDEADIEQEYSARRAAMEAVAERSQQRKAAHILVAIDDDTDKAAAERLAADIRARLDNGESFAALAESYSDDAASAKSGGDLGWLRRGDLPESLDQVVFSLAEGQVSEPVMSDAGIHIVQLVATQERELPTLAEMHDSIRDDLLSSHADLAMAADVQTLGDLAFEHPDLQQPAATLGLEIRTSDWFTRENPADIAKSDAVIKAMTTPAVATDGLNSEPVELADGKYAVIRIADRKPAAMQPLEEVRSQVIGQVKHEAALAALDALSEQARAQVAEGSDLDALAAQWGVELQSANAVSRQSRSPGIELVRNAFSVPRAEIGEAGRVDVVRLANGDLAAIQVTGLEDGGKAHLNNAQKAMARAELGNQNGARSARQMLTYRRAKTDVDVNENRLAAMGAPVQEQD